MKKSSILPKILSLHEAAKAAKDVLETTRRPAGTRNFAMLQGYIPDDSKKKFNNLTRDYVSILEHSKVQNKQIRGGDGCHGWVDGDGY